MKKIGLVLIVVIILFIWQFSMIYHHLQVQTQTKSEKAIKMAKSQFPIKKILSSEEFRGDSSYEVIEAALKNGTKLWIFEPETKTKSVPITASASNGYTKTEIIKDFKAKVAYKRLISVKLGLVNKNNDPAWEFTYIDPSGDLVYSYYDFYSGKAALNPIALK